MNAETIAKALGGRKAGGGWTARCPSHDDHEPSLSIRDGDDGKVLVRCHAGCAFHPRCPLVVDRCRVEVPRLDEVSPGRRVACHLVEQTADGPRLPDTPTAVG